MTNTPPWLKRAIECIGVHEAPGAGDNPKILAWAKACGGEIAKVYRHDSIAWCAMFVNYCLVSTGFKGNDSLWALNMRTLGTALKGPAVGAIASKQRVGGGHTFFVLGRDNAGNVIGVGGNQGDAVNRKAFPLAGLKFNWPAGYALPPAVGLASLPIVDSAPYSQKEN
ncbi:MAG: TIGR02594 family protein [Alphaproteobacteria bacterium]|nr:TIGR02594 family protein [Alphaproteobacteria bacterium]